MDINEKIAKEARALKAAGATIAKIKGFLLYSDVSAKEADAWLKAEGFSGSNSGKFTQVNTLKFLQAGVSEYDLFEALINAQAKNECRWVNDRNKIRKVINSVFAKFGEPVAEVAATAEQKLAAKAIVAGTYKGAANGLGGEKSETEKGIAAAWAKLSEAKEKHAKGYAFGKREARKFHPDRVTCYGDADLERAYCDFYQAIT